MVKPHVSSIVLLALFGAVACGPATPAADAPKTEETAKPADAPPAATAAPADKPAEK